MPLISSEVRPSSQTYQTLCSFFFFPFFHTHRVKLTLPIYSSYYYIIISIYCYPLEFGWPNRGYTLGENWSSLLLQLHTLVSHAQLRPSMLWLVLSWDCTGLVHRITTAEHSHMQLPRSLQSTPFLYRHLPGLAHTHFPLPLWDGVSLSGGHWPWLYSPPLR